MASSSARRQRVKLFKHKGGQAVPIPEGLELEGDDVVVHREGNSLVIEPANQVSSQPNGEPVNGGPESLVTYFRSLAPLDVEWEPIPDLPAEPVDL